MLTDRRRASLDHEHRVPLDGLRAVTSQHDAWKAGSDDVGRPWAGTRAPPSLFSTGGEG